MMKTRMKVSGRFRTEQGADDFAVLRSVANTARKNKLNVMESLSGSSESFLKGPLRNSKPQASNENESATLLEFCRFSS